MRDLQTLQSTVSQFVGLAITVIFGVEAVVKVGVGAWNSVCGAFESRPKVPASKEQDGQLRDQVVQN